MNLLISRCLLGEPCRYDGRGVPKIEVEKLQKAGFHLILVCPEELGGLSTPRPPAEVQEDGRVMNQMGQDVTQEYQQGAEFTLAQAQKWGCKLAILKARSPSCGSKAIYDGSFKGRLVPGEGVTAKLLKQNGVVVMDEEDWEEKIEQWLEKQG
ncbi:MAG: DUF523 domain-containing protein [Lawsonibacter sp.]|jgi:uncharacterized protein YbbK (DUF523 family)